VPRWRDDPQRAQQTAGFHIRLPGDTRHGQPLPDASLNLTDQGKPANTPNVGQSMPAVIFSLPPLVGKPLEPWSDRVSLAGFVDWPFPSIVRVGRVVCVSVRVAP
ncbi:MAG: hypothetical protein WCG47_13955, partial [Dermatophilaceae bacterium]